MTSKNLHLVVAACKNRGIGINGHLPWRLRGDMAFFKRITTETKDPAKQNAVIMGRKTWESIPAKFRPLPGRINVIISNTIQEAPGNAVVANGLDQALQILTSDVYVSRVEKIFIIGGNSVYKSALESPSCFRIYLTQVLEDFECDTFLPQFDTSVFQPVSLPEVDDQIKTECNVQYRWEVYQKMTEVTAQNRRGPPYFSIMACMLRNRGIGNNGDLCWPSLSKDYQHYMNLCFRPRCGKRNVIIKGRKTWESTCLGEKTEPGAINIVISGMYTECPEHCHKTVKTFEEALEVAAGDDLAHVVEEIWVLGGAGPFKMALESPRCHRLYLTRVHAEFESDVFFPPFESHFQKISDPDVTSDILEEKGIQYHFEVYENIHMI